MPKSLKIFSTIVGVLWIIFGLISSAAAVTVLFGTGISGYAEILAQQAGEEVTDFPYFLAVVGSILVFLLSILYFVGAFALLARKKWAYLAVALVAAAGLASVLVPLIGAGSIDFLSIIWSLVYLGLAYWLYKTKDAPRLEEAPAQSA
jgi:hypothetical protein